MKSAEPMSLLTDKHKIEAIQREFIDCVERCHAWKVPISENIVLKSELDRSEQYYAITHYDEKRDQFETTVSDLIWKEYKRRPLEALHNVLLHELCHTIRGCFNHGKHWRYWVEKLNAEHGTKINPHPFSAKETDLF